MNEVARIRAALRLLSPDHITPQGRWILERVLDEEESDCRSTDSCCQCEHIEHFPQGHEYMAVPAGERRAMHVGLICDECATTHMRGYLMEPEKGTVMNTTKDPEALIGYKDEDGCLIPIRNWDPGHVFHGQPVPEEWTPVHEKDINDDDWHVTI